MPSVDHLLTFRRAPATLRQSLLERFARRLAREVARGAAFHCLVTTDAQLHQLNAAFRGKDQPADVLSFPAWPGGAYLGDIAISLPRARAQARAFGHSVEREIQILMLHGVLHLLGYDHQTDGGRMLRAEARWRARLGLPAGLTERVHP